MFNYAGVSINKIFKSKIIILFILKKFTTIKKMKTVTLLKSSFILALFGVSTGWSQVQNYDNFFIGNDSHFYIGTDSFTMGSSAQTKTTRTASTYGVLIFGSGATASGAADANFLDGYARTMGTSEFVFPVGQAGVYAPIAAIPTTATGVDAAYYNANPTTIGAALDASVTAISSTQYWHMLSASADAQVVLSWRSSSNVSTLTSGVLTDLVIAGWNGTSWVQIPSTLEVSANSFLGSDATLTTGTIITDAAVDLNTYSYFTLASKGGACSPLITSSGVTKTWNGSWSPSAPTLADPVIISSAYSGNLACNSLTLNANVTLADGQSVEIVNGASGTGKIIMSSQASVVQRNGASTAPNIELTKQTRTLHVNDYVYWGTPIAGDFFSQLADAKAVTGALTGAFDLKYKYTSGAGGGWSALTATTTGKGYITRVAPQAPFTSASATDKINLKFTGVANNGDITVAVAKNVASPNGGTSHNLLANPYPSAIDGDKFLIENTDIDGVLYVWQAGTAPAAGTGNYAQADYLTYTRAGSVATSGVTGTFDGKIGSGQGFKVKALNTGNVTFTNCMRLLGDNTNFFRSANTSVSGAIDFDSFKLSMTGANGVYSQILIAYSDQTTLGYDRMYDASRNSVSSAMLYSIFETDNTKMAINARPTFVNTDEVPLGVSKSNTVNEAFTVSISDKKGVFTTAGVNVYIHDTVNNTYHNLTNGDFTFSSNVAQLNNRFKVVYQASALDNTDFNSYISMATINDGTLKVTATIGMSEIQVYDITGKLIQVENANGEFSLSKPFNHAEGFYIAKIKLENEGIATQKLINRE